MAARYVLSPVAVEGGTRRPLAATLIDPGRGAPYTHSSVISDGIGRPGERDGLAFSLVFGRDMGALEQHPEVRVLAALETPGADAVKDLLAGRLSGLPFAARTRLRDGLDRAGGSRAGLDNDSPVLDWLERASGLVAPWKVAGLHPGVLPGRRGSTVVFEDAFTVGADVNLADHTPTGAGNGWSELVNTAASAVVRIQAGDDFAEPSTSDDGAIVMLADHAGTLTPEQDVEATLTIPGSSNPLFGLVGRMADADNGYGFSQSGSASPTLFLDKRVSGVNTELGNSDSAASGAVHLLELRDATKKVFVGGVEEVSSTDNALTAAGKGGLHFGDRFRSRGSPVVNANMKVDDFKVTDQGVAAGLSPGEIALLLEDGGAAM